LEVWFWFLLAAIGTLFYSEIANVEDRFKHPIRLVAVLLALSGLFLIYSNSTGSVNSISEIWLIIGGFLWLLYLVWYLIAYWLKDVIETLFRVL